MWVKLKQNVGCIYREGGLCLEKNCLQIPEEVIIEFLKKVVSIWFIYFNISTMLKCGFL
jgi:hypothetical protein